MFEKSTVSKKTPHEQWIDIDIIITFLTSKNITEVFANA